jgi:hypothetical protein
MLITDMLQHCDNDVLSTNLIALCINPYTVAINET